MRLLVVVPCRDERRVVERRLANLAAGAWPECARPHRLVLVDDGSKDDTLELARAACARLFDPAHVACEVVANAARPGKAGAVRTALERREREVDLVVLTDADVVHEHGSLPALARAFARDGRLALACAAQSFVEDLADDGSTRAKGGGAPRAAGAPFDRATARVRAFESRRGALYSLHGQLCAWRAGLGLAPTLGIAADDLDLVGQVRARSAPPRRVELVAEAVFLEVKARGAAAEGQALRRARAWFQAVRRMPPDAGPPLARAQSFFYRHAPGLAPWACGALGLFGLCALAWWQGIMVALGGAALLALMSAIPALSHWTRLVATIARAARLERRATLPDQWSMERR
ncbi:MAG: hypothetical protein RL112_2551 [Planctomycetota bacterium]